MRDLEGWKMEFGRQYELDTQGFMLDDNGCTLETIKSIGVRMTETIDDAICSEIIKAAREQGLTDVIILDKTMIIRALRNAAPMKVDILKGTCPNCGAYIISDGDNYCNICGQRLEW
jgi:hypothetical protein